MLIPLPVAAVEINTGMWTSEMHSSDGLNDTNGSHTIYWNYSLPYHPSNSIVEAYLLQGKSGENAWNIVQQFNTWSGSKAFSGQDEGLHNYSIGGTAFSGMYGYVPIAGYTDVLVSSPAPTEASSTVVGNTPYSMSVTGKGDAAISVPLEALPGVDGLQPSLTLSYNSGREDQRLEWGFPAETLGYGWKLAGLSEIRSCGIGQSPTGLCLDNMPLVLMSGTHQQAGAIYRTQIESYIRIELKTDANSGAYYFEAKMPDGTIREYGHYPYGNDPLDNFGPYLWSLTQETDTNGNTIEYAYHNDSASGVNYPVSIRYSGAEILFKYLFRSDTQPITVGSKQISQSAFLHTVTMTMNDAPVREYRLISDVSGQGWRRLKKVQQCGYNEAGTSSSCLPALSFGWTDSSGAYTAGFKTAVTSVTDGLGATSEFEYSKIVQGGSHSFLFSERPFGNGILPSNTQLLSGTSGAALKHVVTRLSRDNGLGGDHDTTYAYQDKGLKSTQNWGFLGFYAQRIKDEQSGIVTYAQYRQDYPYFGQVAAVRQYDNIYGSHTQMLTRAESQYAKQTINHSSGNSTLLPYSNRQTQFIYENGSLLGATETAVSQTLVSGLVDTVDTTTRTADSVTINTGTQSYWGDVKTHTLSNIKQTTETSASFSNRTSGSNWLVGFVDTTVTSLYDGAPGGAGVTRIDRDGTFDPETNSNDILSATLYPGDPVLEKITTYDYDAYGNILEFLLTGNSSGSRSSKPSDYLENRYPQKMTNARGYITQIAYDLRFGAAKQVTDPNGQVTSTVRDNFGRVASITNSDGVTVTTSYASCASVSCPTVNGVAAVYRVQTDSPVTPISRSYHDKLGRVIRTENESFGGAFSRQDTWYDDRGRVKKTSLPYFSGATVRYITPTYNSLTGRITQLDRPDGSSTSTSYAVSGDNVKVTVSDVVKNSAGGTVETQTKVSEYNILGQLVSTTDADGKSQATTVSYIYDGAGNTLSVSVNGGSAGTTTTTFEYDAAGNRTKMTGPDVGTITNTYNAFGEVRTTTNNIGAVITYNYDPMGRISTRVESYSGASHTTTWNWDGATNGIGLLQSRTNQSGFTETYSYNSNNKLSSVVTQLVAGGYNQSYTTTHTYDSSGRPLVTSYPGGFAVKREYNTRGYLYRLKDNSSSAVLQTFNTVDAFGNATQETYGNGVVTNRTYDPTTGRLTDINTTKGSTTLQNLDYAWRSNGTLESRIANPDTGINTTRKETFTYDPLNRLTQAKSYLNGGWQRDLDTSYNNLGNITSKTSTQSGDVDVTGYAYGAGAAGPHAVTSATIDGVGHTLTYNANGAVTKYDIAGTSDDKYISYTPTLNQVEQIVIGSSLTDSTPVAKDEFLYGPDGARFYRKSIYQEGGQTKTEYVFYVGDYEHSYVFNDSAVKESEKTSIGGNILHIKTVAPGLSITEGVEYLHRDHLGSVESITDASGNLLQKMAFEPFGSRKDSDWMRNIDATELANLLDDLNIRTSRGYTGHEHLDRTGFIHMNGRVYDPVLGRFLSPDPLVQSPTSSQNWNRYSYVFNSPVSFTDPSGFVIEYIEKHYRLYKGVAIRKPELDSNGKAAWDVLSESLFGPPGYRLNETEDGLIKLKDWRDNPFDQAVQKESTLDVSGVIATWGIAGLMLESPGGSVGILKDKSAKWYPSGWKGNGSVKTTQLSKLAKPLGPLGFGVSTLADADALANGEITSGKAAINTGFNLLTFTRYSILGLSYAINDTYGGDIFGGIAQWVVDAQRDVMWSGTNFQ